MLPIAQEAPLGAPSPNLGNPYEHFSINLPTLFCDFRSHCLFERGHKSHIRNFRDVNFFHLSEASFRRYWSTALAAIVARGQGDAN